MAKKLFDKFKKFFIVWIMEPKKYTIKVTSYLRGNCRTVAYLDKEFPTREAAQAFVDAFNNSEYVLDAGEFTRPCYRVVLLNKRILG